ncbi:MAG: hypothetical protein KAT86_04925, partial [Candidatus Latescibacteria bacterium]|nr:hypothetical protein [Candidatus Latescibacterota bacterium]
KEIRDEKFLGIINKADYRISLRKDLILWPKWKQMYKYVNPTKRWKLSTKELSEIFFLLIKYQFSKQLWINSGVEYEIFNNLLKKPEPPPSEFVEDFRKWTLASQFSNSCAYMGYVLTSNLGVRWSRRSFEDRTEPPSTTAFVTVYVGPE